MMIDLISAGLMIFFSVALTFICYLSKKDRDIHDKSIMYIGSVVETLQDDNRRLRQVIDDNEKIILINAPSSLSVEIEQLQKDNQRLRKMMLETQNIIMENAINKAAEDDRINE